MSQLSSPSASSLGRRGRPPGVTRLASDGLTDRQRAILDVIKDAVEARGYPPSIREICEATGLASTSSVSHQLSVLAKKGFLRRDPKLPRAVDVRIPDGQYQGAAGQPGEPDPSAIAGAVLAGPGDRTAAAGLETIPPVNDLVSDDDVSVSAAVAVPVLGRIAAGVPLLADQAVEDVFPLPRALVGHGTVFLLKVAGDSMVDAAISDGDWVAIRQQQHAENGEIVAAMIDGEATVKTWRQRDGHAWLMPHNPAYAPIPADDAVILGKVVTVLRKV